jgi:hypothetical protein
MYYADLIGTIERRRCQTLQPDLRNFSSFDEVDQLGTKWWPGCF